MPVRDIILGKPLAPSEEAKEQLTVVTGVPVLGLDALASTAYGPEAALAMLLPLGLAGLWWYPIITLAVVVKLVSLYFSYQQIASAYPNGGGAYVVAKDNLGSRTALWAAVALLLDYLLNVAVAITAGVGAIVSAVPALRPHVLALSLLVLLTLTYLNLRGVRESGLAFVLPVAVFVALIGAAIAVGLAAALGSGGHPQAIVPPPSLPPQTAGVSAWLLLTAFANGSTALTGVEAVSNGVPLFREPKIPRAHRTLKVIAVILGVFLLALGYLCPVYHIAAMDETKPGYQTILSQLLAAVAGRGLVYYAGTASIFVVLTYSAETSFADFPRVCSLLADDRCLPQFFSIRGRRLGYSYGIITLAIFSALLLIAFRGLTNKLIPLFGIAAFGVFFFSQAGMAAHLLRGRETGVRASLANNALGAATTAFILVILIIANFQKGAWTVVIVPALVLLLGRIKRHYAAAERELERRRRRVA